MFENYALEAVQKLEEKIAYTFKNKRLAVQALIQPNWNDPVGISTSYEPLEFLGDKVLNLCIAYEAVMMRHKQSIRMLSMHLENRQNNAYLANYAYINDWGSLLLRNGNPPRPFPNSTEPEKRLADVMEAVFAAIFVDTSCNFQRIYEVYEHLGLGLGLDDGLGVTFKPIPLPANLIRPVLSGGQTYQKRLQDDASVENQEYFGISYADQRRIKLLTDIGPTDHIPDVSISVYYGEDIVELDIPVWNDERALLEDAIETACWILWTHVVEKTTPTYA
jgi:hypothetical protein